MTREEARKAAEVMLAYADGKEIEFKTNHKDGWSSLSSNNKVLFNWFVCNYRIKSAKSEPKLRPWKPEEVPVGAWIRAKNEATIKYNYFTTIIGVTSTDIVMAEETFEDMFDSFEKALTTSEYSIDKGKTWHPCGVLE